MQHSRVLSSRSSCSSAPVQTQTQKLSRAASRSTLCRHTVLLPYACLHRLHAYPSQSPHPPIGSVLPVRHCHDHSTHSHSHSLSLTLTHSHSLSLSLSLSLTLTHSLTHSLTHVLTHARFSFCFCLLHHRGLVLAHHPLSCTKQSAAATGQGSSSCSLRAAPRPSCARL